MPTTVVKRDGRREEVDLSKIHRRINLLADGLHEAVDTLRVAKRVVQGVHDGVHTWELDELTAEVAASLASTHPDYSSLAGRVSVSNLHKKTQPSMACLLPLLGDDEKAFVGRHLAALDDALQFDRDFGYDYFGFKTLEKAGYLLRQAGEVVERPQVMLMRVSLGIHVSSSSLASEEEQLRLVLETYDAMSRGLLTHATPTMFHAGTRHPHLASCFLIPMRDDSIRGIFETQLSCALISQSAGGIGFSVSNVRAEGTPIHSTGGKSNGLLPMLRCFESTARYVAQGGGKRKGAFAAYLEPWHRDVRVFLEMKKNLGAEELRARDLFYALWIPDLFMRRVEANASWTLLCPYDCPDLVDLVGSAFDARYEEYEQSVAEERKVRVRAQELWFAILDAQIETGTPYMLYKDACNLKSNHRHLGTIRSSNLCTEVVQFSSRDEIAVCNLASIALPRFVKDGAFDHQELHRVVQIVVRNIDNVIDKNAYAVPEARESNLRHRPMGIGVQGLADTFALLRHPFDSPEAAELNRSIFETMYHAALTASIRLARERGVYQSYEGSPLSKGKLQFDLWGVQPSFDSRWDWNALRDDLRAYGARNSLLLAPMPTASTAQILGNNECFEPFTSNIYKRRVLAGEFTLFNRHLVRELSERGLWDETMRKAIISGGGSVQHIDGIPADVKALFKTAWEMKMRTLIDMAAARGPYIDQSQSLNLFVEEPTHSKLSSMHFYGWKKGLKTGMYYLRTRPAANAINVLVPKSDPPPAKVVVCTDEVCLSCSS